MPNMTGKFKIGTDPSGETLTDFWRVSDMYHFENVGFSKNVGSGTLKYLLCADCEIGPIGWHDTATKDEFYVAAKRVQYGADWHCVLKALCVIFPNIFWQCVFSILISVITLYILCNLTLRIINTMLVGDYH